MEYVVACNACKRILCIQQNVKSLFWAFDNVLHHEYLGNYQIVIMVTTAATLLQCSQYSYGVAQDLISQRTLDIAGWLTSAKKVFEALLTY